MLRVRSITYDADVIRDSKAAPLRCKRAADGQRHQSPQQKHAAVLPAAEERYKMEQHPPDGFDGNLTGEQRDELPVPDENPEKADRISIEYHRITKIKPGKKPEGVDWEYVTWDYREQLVIDRASESIEYERVLGSGCAVKTIYHVEEGVAAFLDSHAPDALLQPEGNAPVPEAPKTPLEVRTYRVTVLKRHGEARTRESVCGRDGLSGEWEEFLTDLRDFLAFYNGMAEILDPSSHETGGHKGRLRKLLSRIWPFPGR